MTRQPPSTTTPARHATRSYDGTDNDGRDLGRVGREIRDVVGTRVAPTRDFEPDRRPSAREVSTTLCRQRGPHPDPHKRTEFMWAFGQFLDHTLDLVHFRRTTPDGQKLEGEAAPITVPDDDPRLEFRGTTIPFVRSLRLDDDGHQRPAGQGGRLRNDHTPYVDAANVYGTDADRAGQLRERRGGRLELPDGLLPKNRAEDPFPNAPDLTDPGRFFLAGDIRANEHSILLGLHTVFAREHNRVCAALKVRHRDWDDETLYQHARRTVIGELQVITYEEFLPALLGVPLEPYRGYDPSVDPGVTNLFATACYRIGHSMVADEVILDAGSTRLLLRDAFFAPEFVERIGIEPFLSRLVYRPMNAVDVGIVDGLREQLFGEGSVRMHDLAALNVQRGRDHGLPGFNSCRTACGLPTYDRFEQICPGNPGLAKRLADLYGDIDEIDAWIGALAEEPSVEGRREGRLLGDVMHLVLADQFRRTRDGDYFWYENDPALTDAERAAIRRRRFGHILADNTHGVIFPDDVFHLPY